MSMTESSPTEEVSCEEVSCEEISCQALVIGAGPVGLFAVFELGLLDIDCCLVDILLRPGGQCAELYPEKPIYDIPALPTVTGRELAERLMQQIAPFQPVFHLGETLTRLEGSVEQGFRAHSSSGKVFCSTVVVVASGGGEFVAKKPPLQNLSEFENRSVFYAVKEKNFFRDKSVVVAGGGDSALDWTLELCTLARKTTLLHRRAEFRAAPASVNKLMTLQKQKKVDLVIATLDAIEGANGHIERLRLHDKEGDSFVLDDVDAFLPFFGLTMRPGPVAEFGLGMNEGGIEVDTEAFETSRRGVFAVGDISRYAGKLKLILSGFHETALMAHKAHSYVYPDRKLRFQHTTSSSSLRKKLTAACA